MNKKSDLAEPAKTLSLTSLSVLLAMIAVGFACSHRDRSSAPSAPSSASPTAPAPIAGKKVNREIDSKLLAAAESEDVKQVRALLDAGADIEAREEMYGRTPLMEAAIAGKAPVVAALLERGAAVDAKDTVFGSTALMFAAGEGGSEIVRLLLAKGADVSSKNNEGYTALDAAEEESRRSVILLLKKAGARNGDRSDSRSTAEKEGDLRQAAVDSNVEKIRDLLAQGVNVDARDESGWTALRNAVFQEKLAIVRLLLANRADPNLQDYKDGSTALHWAAQIGRTDILTALLDTGADPNMHDTFSGITPLMHAASGGNVAAVKVLIAKGADVNASNKFGESVLSQAISAHKGSARGGRSGETRSLSQVIGALRQAGAK